MQSIQFSKFKSERVRGKLIGYRRQAIRTAKEKAKVRKRKEKIERIRV